MRKLQLLILLFLTISCSAFAQFSAWQYRVPVDVAEASGISHTNYAVLLTFDSQTLIANGKLQANGGDLRFGDACGATSYPYWIESGLNTTQTMVWVLLPSITANTTTTISMYYGNAAAPDGNNFAATFPAAIRTNGANLTLTGSLTPDFVWVEATDTLFLTAGATLTMSNVRKLRVDATGEINGVGRGFQAPTINTAGTGPGGGGTSTNSGNGGGSYAGVGGTGGYDSGDTPGTGGAAYGTAAGTDCEMGSSGGSGTTVGGSGGGALNVTAEYVEVNGSINMSGGVAVNTTSTSRGGGGGAGGCIMITCASANGNGALTASGSNGAPGTSTANDSGGGGGGGRIKSFSEAAWPGTLVQTTAGGTGGPYGTFAPGQPGGIGSQSNVVQAWGLGLNPTSTIGSETLPPRIISTDTAVCNGAVTQIMATPGMVSYLWSSGGTTDIATVTTGGTYSVMMMDSAGCTYNDTIILGTIATTPIVITGNGTVCNGGCDTLTATAGFVSYLWSNGATTQSIVACTSGSYDLSGTDANGCVLSDTFVVTVVPPITLVTLPQTICDGSTALLDASGNYASWIWSTGETTPTITVTTSGSYTVTVTDANGCQGIGTWNITVNPLPTPTVVQTGTLLSVQQTFPTYQWLLNGSPISGANASTYTATGTGSYSVQVTDVNGCTNISDTTNVVVGLEMAATLGATIAPNPTRGATTLAFTLDSPREMTLQVTDALGKVVYTTALTGVAGTNRVDVQLAGLAAGMYNLRLSDGTAQQVLRVLKQ